MKASAFHPSVFLLPPSPQNAPPPTRLAPFPLSPPRPSALLAPPLSLLPSRFHTTPEENVRRKSNHPSVPPPPPLSPSLSLFSSPSFSFSLSLSLAVVLSLSLPLSLFHPSTRATCYAANREKKHDPGVMSRPPAPRQLLPPPLQLLPLLRPLPPPFAPSAPLRSVLGIPSAFQA